MEHRWTAWTQAWDEEEDAQKIGNHDTLEAAKQHAEAHGAWHASLLITSWNQPYQWFDAGRWVKA